MSLNSIKLPSLSLPFRPYSSHTNEHHQIPSLTFFKTEPLPSKKTQIRIRETKILKSIHDKKSATIIRGQLIKWQKGDQLGDKLQRCMNVSTGEILVVKEISNFQKKEKILDNLTKISRLKNKNIVKCLGFECIGDRIFYYMEYIGGASLQWIIKQYGKFSLEMAKKYVKQITKILFLLEKEGVPYSQLKLDQIFIDNNGTLKIALDCENDLNYTKIKNILKEIFIQLAIGVENISKINQSEIISILPTNFLAFSDYLSRDDIAFSDIYSHAFFL